MKNFEADNSQFQLNERVSHAHKMFTTLLDPSNTKIVGDIKADAMTFNDLENDAATVEKKAKLEALKPKLNAIFLSLKTLASTANSKIKNTDKKVLVGVGVVALFALFVVLKEPSTNDEVKKAADSAASSEMSAVDASAKTETKTVNIVVPDDDLKHLEEIWAKEVTVYRAAAQRILLIKKIANSNQEKAAFYSKIASQKKHADVAILTIDQLTKMSVQKAANKNAAQAMSISLHNLLIPFIREFPDSYIN